MFFWNLKNVKYVFSNSEYNETWKISRIVIREFFTEIDTGPVISNFCQPFVLCIYRKCKQLNIRDLPASDTLLVQCLKEKSPYSIQMSMYKPFSDGAQC